MNVRLNNGFVLLPVILILALLGSMAYLLNQQSVVALNQVESLTLKEQEKYAAEAGLVLAYEELKEDEDCTDYAVTSTGSFNGQDYQVSLSQSSGSPVTLKVSTDQGNGTFKHFSREVTMYNGSAFSEQLIPSLQTSYIRSDKTTTNYASQSTLHVRYKTFFGIPFPDRISLLQFDVGSITAEAADIVSVNLALHLEDSPDTDDVVNVRIIKLNSSWLEDEVTYGERLSGVSWSTSDVVMTPPIAEVAVDQSVVGWTNWDVTSLAKEWLDGTTVNNGFEVWGEEGVTDNLEFIGPNHSDTTKHPVLSVLTPCECGQVCS